MINQTKLVSISLIGCPSFVSDLALSLFVAYEEFFNNHILQVKESDTISDIGGIVGFHVASAAVLWILIFLCLCRGVRFSGLILRLVPFVMALFLFIIVVWVATLPG